MDPCSSWYTEPQAARRRWSDHYRFASGSIAPPPIRTGREIVERWGEAATLGQVASDFDLFSQSPNFASGWQTIQTQLSAEGAEIGIVNLAKAQFTDAYADLGKKAEALSDSDIAGAARDLVLAGKTIAGAIDTFQGLFRPAPLSAVPAAIKALTGTMIAIGTGAGLVSAGVGAAVVAGIALAVDVLSSVLSPPAAPAGTICGAPLETPPNWTLGCLGVWGTQVVPGSAYWSRFPVYGNPPDEVWWSSDNFGPGAWRNAFYGIRQPGKDQSYSGLPNKPSPTWRAIDNAFGDYGTLGKLEDDITKFAPYLAPVIAAYVTAWQANAEYGLNGWQMRPNSEVFAHVVRLWNAAHDGSTFRLLTETDGLDLYLDSLVYQIVRSTTAKDVLTADGKGVKVHLGPLKNVPVTYGPNSSSSSPGAATSSSSSSPSAAPAIVTVLTVGALGGLWVLLGKPLSAAAFKAAAGELGKRFARSLP